MLRYHSFHTDDQCDCTDRNRIRFHAVNQQTAKQIINYESEVATTLYSLLKITSIDIKVVCSLREILTGGLDKLISIYAR